MFTTNLGHVLYELCGISLRISDKFSVNFGEVFYEQSFTSFEEILGTLEKFYELFINFINLTAFIRKHLRVHVSHKSTESFDRHIPRMVPLCDDDDDDETGSPGRINSQQPVRFGRRRFPRKAPVRVYFPFWDSGDGRERWRRMVGDGGGKENVGDCFRAKGKRFFFSLALCAIHVCRNGKDVLGALCWISPAQPKTLSGTQRGNGRYKIMNNIKT